jgi:hypothetical protein
LVEQGADTVEGASAGRMPPAEATDAMEARGQDVLEEAAEELEGFQIDVGPLAGGAAAIRPTQSAVGQEGQAPIAGGGLEDVTGVGAGQEGEEPEVVGEAIQDCVGRDFFLCMGRRIEVGTGGATGTRARRSVPSLKLAGAGGNENRSNQRDSRVANPIRPAPPRSGFVQPVTPANAGELSR